MKNISFGFVSSCFILVCGKSNPSDVEWDRYLGFVRSHLRPGLVDPRSIVYTLGGGPTPAQRQKLNDMCAPYADMLKVAVLTQSTVARSIVTALSWFVRGYRAFAPHDLDAALVFLGLSDLASEEVRRLIPRLRLELIEG